MIKTILPIGYCFGVKNTLDNVKKLANNNPTKDIVLFSAPVHNKNALDDLLKIGNIFMLKDYKKKNNNDSILVFSAHGHTSKQEQFAKENGFKIYDSICPFLMFRNKSVLKDIDSFDKIYVIGDEKHPETESLLSLKQGIVCLNPNNKIILEKDDLSKVLVIYQSTINVDSFNLLNGELKKTFKNLTVISVCPECANRFNNLDKIAFNQNDLIIIVGDKTSANTTSLFEKAKTKLDSKRVLFILNVDELKKVPLPININNIYLTSGTSASLEDVTSISNYLENLYK
ncbi:4-hydroxy-3-methylbut-2-enyl diphosphate reductase [Clostridium sp. CAG:288]|nr:4-hydroxy-3-methylbut-2-enyl diphosphate reductase [Clostridium sp. CAG:288]